ncbi:MAG: hypothetical protein IPM98_21425 [Lewinellaceae bacterium]|nr:hypothetical protein [Lewinellaceae bacterium]
MIPYNRIWLDALLTRDAALDWHRQGLFSDEKWQVVQARHVVHFYSPNVFVRIGLAIFTLILLLAGVGLGGLILDADSVEGFALLCFFYGLILLAALEMWAIGSARHFGSGVDDMLLYFGTSMLLGSVYLLLPYNTGVLTYACLTLPFLVAGSIRYLDRLLAAAAFVCLLVVVLLAARETPRLALYILPFAGMLTAAGTYFFAQYGQRRYDWRYWHGVLVVLELLALVFFYVSGNYWVVQQAGAAWFQLEQVPLAWFFWAFTFAVPVAYIFWGLRQKDRLLLDVGLACVAVAVFTFRAYFHVMPLAWAAVIGGVLLFATAYLSIRYLKKSGGAYTYDAAADQSLLQEIEQQLLAQHLAHQQSQTPTLGDSFGGGQFGGGGADGKF